MQCAGAAIVKCEEHRYSAPVAPGCEKINCGAWNGGGNGVKMPLEIFAAQFVDVRAFAGESAGGEIAALHHVVIHDCECAHHFYLYRCIGPSPSPRLKWRCRLPEQISASAGESASRKLDGPLRNPACCSASHQEW